MSKIPLCIPQIDNSDINYIKKTMKSGWVSTAGKYVNLFEEKIQKYTKAKYAIACMSGTSALHISLLLSGVDNKSEVIVPTLSFIAPINAIDYCNAKPIFMDVDDDYSLDIKKTIEFIENNTYLLRSANKGTSAIIDNKGKIVKRLNRSEAGSIEFNVPLIKSKKIKNDLIFFTLLTTYLLIFLFYKEKNAK